MNILHLSDIHFGRNNYGIEENFNNKGKILDELVNTIGQVEDQLKPN